MIRRLRIPSFLLILLLGPTLFIGILLQEMTYLNWFLPAVVLGWLGLFGLWYLLFGDGTGKRRIRRLGILLAVFLASAFLASQLLRYEGSTGGSSFPRFSWVWETPPARSTIPATALPPDSATDTTADSDPAPTPPTDDTALAELPGFLGSDRDGMWKDLPFHPDWTTYPPTLLWRRPMGKGWSSFAVSGQRALTQQQVGDDEHVTCLDLLTGAELWHHRDPEVRLLLERAENSGAAMGGDGPRGTPVIFEGKVYAMGATGIVNCLDLETGRPIWSRALLREFDGGIQRWGMATSPLVLPAENAVVFAGPDSPGPTLIALDPLTGETVWIYEGGGASYSSPRLMTYGGRLQIVSVNAADVSGIDPATGTELWRHPWPGKFPKVAQPIAYGQEGLLVTASYGAGSLLLRITHSAPDGAFTVSEQWKSNRMKTKFSSPVIVGDHAYGLDEGRLACIALATGERVWKREKFGFGQHLLFADRLLVQTEAGDIVVGRVDPEKFHEEGRLAALSSMTWNTPAVAGRYLLARNDREAVCYLLPPPDPNLPTP
ncbi:MAG: PQQ-binding-like beta-propeller repeat protein [Verrucomicrobiaceae bacterium]|nr:PQQ-binding-like beta-propeller repeat protein [Verrucomicrobiaceae bacterium]